MSKPTLPTAAPPRLPPPERSEWEKFLAGFGYAFSGLRYTIRTQRNARVHCVIATLAILLGLFLRISTIEFAMIFITIAAVFVAEMLNTVLEICIDMITPNYHPLAKIAKDVAAGAVLVSAMVAVMVGLLIFGPHLWVLLLSHFR